MKNKFIYPEITVKTFLTESVVTASEGNGNTTDGTFKGIVGTNAKTYQETINYTILEFN